MGKNEFFYLQIVHNIETMIMRGKILSGQKLPSIRQLMAKEKASRSTIEKALGKLVSSGLVCVRDRSGYYVNDISIFDPKQVLNLKKLSESDAMVANLFISAEESDLMFSTAALDPSLIPEVQIANLAARTMKQFPTESISLALPPGNIQFRSAVSNRLNSIGINCTPGDVIITTADNDFLKKLLEILTRKNKGIGIDKICYFGCLQAIKSLHLDVHHISSSPEHGYDVDQAIQLVKSGKVKTLFLNPTLNNPLGYTISEADRIRLVRACEEHECFLVEDDIFCDLQNPENTVKPLKAWDTKGVVIYLGSVSKSVAPGLRAGWCLPGALYSQLLAEMLSENNSVSSPAQMITSQLLKSDILSNHLNQIRLIFARQSRELSMIVEDFFPTGTKMSNPNEGPASVQA